MIYFSTHIKNLIIGELFFGFHVLRKDNLIVNIKITNETSCTFNLRNKTIIPPYSIFKEATVPVKPLIELMTYQQYKCIKLK